MARNITWPSREQWAADAEHSARTQCYTWQRVSAEPTAWITDAELAEARQLAVAVVKAARTGLTRAGRGDERPTLNSYGRDAAIDWTEVNDLSYNWGHITSIARSVNAAPEQAARLAELCGQMTRCRDAAARDAVEKAVAEAVATRNSEAGWAKELERRARIERGPLLTVHTIHEDCTGTTDAPVPYNPPFAH